MSIVDHLNRTCYDCAKGHYISCNAVHCYTSDKEPVGDYVWCSNCGNRIKRFDKTTKRIGEEDKSGDTGPTSSMSFSSSTVSIPPCKGCGRNELHKYCPATGTKYYMSGIHFTKEMEDLYKELKLWQRYASYCHSCALCGDNDLDDFEKFVEKLEANNG